MTDARDYAPDIEIGERPKGPSSYFPSIEKKYGQPIQHWIDIAAAELPGKKHGEVVAILKNQHGLGHGHANAVVAHVRGQD